MKTNMKKTTKGLAMHVHHNILFEYCYDFEGRVNVIKDIKPVNEIEIRLRLFKMLTKEAIAELPEKILKASAEWKKADAEWKKAYVELNKAYAESWHEKYCGCKEWNGKEIDFNKQ